MADNSYYIRYATELNIPSSEKDSEYEIKNVCCCSKN